MSGDFEVKVTCDGIEHKTLVRLFAIWEHGSLIEANNFDLNFLEAGNFITVEDLFGNKASGYVISNPKIYHKSDYCSLEFSFRTENQINKMDEKQRDSFYQESGLAPIEVKN